MPPKIQDWDRDGLRPYRLPSFDERDEVSADGATVVEEVVAIPSVPQDVVDALVAEAEQRGRLLGVEDGRAAGYAEGFEVGREEGRLAGLSEAETGAVGRRVAVLEAVTQSLSDLSAVTDKVRDSVSADGAQTLFQFIRAILPDLLRHTWPDEVVAVASDCIKRIPSGRMRFVANATALEILATEGFAKDDVDLVEDPSASDFFVRVDWDGGSTQLDIMTAAKEAVAVIKNHLSSKKR
jgi:flagellar biosynthesis/type III secretory pathway protein FliH